MNSIRFALSGTVFISLSFLKDSFSGKSPLAGRLFSPSTLSVSMEEARLLLVAGEPMRHWSFSCGAAVAASCGWFKSELSSPGQISPWFLLSWYMCLMSLKIPLKLSVAFFCEFSFSFIFGCPGSLPPQCVGFSVWWLLLMLNVGSRVLASVVVEHRIHCSAACAIFPAQGSNLCPLRQQADS